MTRLPDPMVSLQSLQQQVRKGMPTHPGALSPSIHVFADKPAGVQRYSYARLEQGRVKALAIFVFCDPIDGIPCFNLGYAVPEFYRNRGYASEMIEKGIAELRHGLGRHGIKAFYVEAVVSKDNVASQRVASKIISPTYTETTDAETGYPILAYGRLVEC